MELKKFEISVEVNHVDGYQVFACLAENETIALEKLKSGDCNIIDQELEVVGLEKQPIEIIESEDISSRLPSDRICRLMDDYQRQAGLVSLVEQEDFLSKLKGPMRGEYSMEVEHSCSACNFDGPDEECEVCGGEINYTDEVAIDWTTQKEIIVDALKHLGFNLDEYL